MTRLSRILDEELYKRWLEKYNDEDCDVNSMLWDLVNEDMTYNIFYWIAPKSYLKFRTNNIVENYS